MIRTACPHVRMLPDFEPANRIGEFWGTRRAAASPCSWIDCEEDPTLGARRAPFIIAIRPAASQRHLAHAPLIRATGICSPARIGTLLVLPFR
jgi:hypothetical protein